MKNRVEWKQVDETKIRDVWVCSNDECPNILSAQDHIIAISHPEYEIKGIPVCRYCDRPMGYVQTEMKE